MRRPTGKPNVISPDLNESKPFCSPQDQIQWGILFLSRHLRRFGPWEREQCLQDAWEWARQRGDLLCLQIIRDYRECYKESGPTYRRHQDWFFSNWENPEFWAEWENRFSSQGRRGRRRASASNWLDRGRGSVHLKDALILFKRLGVDVPSLSARGSSAWLIFGLPGATIPIEETRRAMS